MDENALTIDLRERISRLVPAVHAHCREQTGVYYPPEVIEHSMHVWLENRIDSLLDDVAELITSPHLSAAQQFQQILDQQMHLETARHELPVAIAEAAEDESGTVFSGYRPYSPQKLGAMIEYISRSGMDIYKTSLNKLLFYSDLTYYYLHRHGISGVTYVNMPYGPVPDRVENVLEDLAASGRITRGAVRGIGSNATLIKAGDAAPAVDDILSDDEKKVLDWVIGRYGQMSATEISALSHREKAYSNTRPGEPIAYEYAKFFETLPEK